MAERQQPMQSPSTHDEVILISSLHTPAETAIVPYRGAQFLTDRHPSQSNLALNGPETEEDGRKSKKRSKNWTRVETLRLIKLRKKLDSRFSRSGPKAELWHEIAETLQREKFARDALQCREKWEKLMAGFKDVREGLKSRAENPYYDDLHPLLSGKRLRREKDTENVRKEFDVASSYVDSGPLDFTGTALHVTGDLEDQNSDLPSERSYLKKRKRCGKHVPITDIAAVESLLEMVISRQQRFFREVLDSLERKEQIRERIRQEKEEKWRAEERVQRNIFNDAMIVLAQKLLAENGATAVPATKANSDIVSMSDGLRQVPKKRSKNWKRGEVLQLIKLRGEMDVRFANSARRAALWEELADTLERAGIKRDGKQCREKWDKLMAACKDVMEGKRKEGDVFYFVELQSIVGRKSEEGKPM